MTATDELRAMLDARGVEWEKPTGIIEQIKTVWRDGPWEFTAVDTGDGELSVYVEHRFWLTPAQAVEATLGRGECEITTQDEIERLRSCLSDADENAKAIMREVAELRELVADMWRFTGTACKKYPRLFDPAAQGGQAVRLNMIDAFEQRMRELGIEVDR